MLSGKLALVTGAGEGIGRATCKILGEAGAQIIAVDANVTTAKETVLQIKEGDHYATRMDVSKSSDVKATFEKIILKYRCPPNVIVNVGGILKNNFLINTTEKEFQEDFDVNLKGTYLVTKTACEFLIDVGLPGSVINVSSLVAKSGNRGQSNYASVRAAVETFSKCVATEMARYKIRCNTVLPGLIGTAMIENIPVKTKNYFLSKITPEKIAEIIKFLASDQSSYVTGSSIQVSDGFE